MSGQQNETQVGASGAADKSPEENKKGLGRFIQWGLITVGIVGGIAINGASIGIAAAGRLTNMAYVVVAAGAFTAGITGPLNLYNEYILKKNNTMRDHINAIRNEVNRLAIENNKLHNLINELENDVGRLKDIEEALSTLAKAQGASIEKLLFLVQENKRINRETKKILSASRLQDVLDIVIAADRDGSFHFDDNEIDYLILRLHNLEYIPDFDEEKFRQELHATMGAQTFSVVLKLVQELLPEMEFGMESDDEEEKRKGEKEKQRKTIRGGEEKSEKERPKFEAKFQLKKNPRR
mmetsp:Transcript_4636/g.6069  ORF Transcript_4636/g.6069 Transcript_4636/m.6069 type:complete len:295 (+) Transcript_4636:16-900(+)